MRLKLKLLAVFAPLWALTAACQAVPVKERTALEYSDRFFLNIHERNIVAELGDIPQYTLLPAKTTDDQCVVLECSGEKASTCQFRDKARFFGVPIQRLDDKEKIYAPLRGPDATVEAALQAAKMKADYALIKLHGDKADALIRPRYRVSTEYKKTGPGFQSTTKACAAANAMAFSYIMVKPDDKKKEKQEKKKQDVNVKLEIQGSMGP